MKKIILTVALLTMAVAVTAVSRTVRPAVDLSGTWVFSVDLENGGHGDPTFVFKQDKEKLTGSYDGPLGQYNVTGTVKDNKAVFGFDFTNDGENYKATYAATVESAAKMTGTLEITNGGPKGKWTATKK